MKQLGLKWKYALFGACDLTNDQSPYHLENKSKCCEESASIDMNINKLQPYKKRKSTLTIKRKLIMQKNQLAVWG
ncbi:hypothetical protein C1T29_19925 [Bacillus sp. MBGLi79]|nr:hypothetical protein C1T29_19925 [Bacillus sp. MBGLi79]